MKHTENLGIVTTVYSDIFWHIWGHSMILNHAQAFSGTLKNTVTNSGIIEAY